MANALEALHRGMERMQKRGLEPDVVYASADMHLAFLANTSFHTSAGEKKVHKILGMDEVQMLSLPSETAVLVDCGGFPEATVMSETTPFFYTERAEVVRAEDL